VGAHAAGVHGHRRVLADEWVVDPDQLGPVRRWTSDELDSTPEALPIGWTA
jgi:hypothetical protein